jgi:hypothetical protein
MTADHSPAPWKRSKGPFGSILVGPVMLPHPGRDAPQLDRLLAEREFDAALIGAAPKMLLLLRGLADRDIGETAFRGTLTEARSLIAAYDEGDDEGRSTICSLRSW